MSVYYTTLYYTTIHYTRIHYTILYYTTLPGPGHVHPPRLDERGAPGVYSVLCPSVLYHSILCCILI